MKLRNKKTGEIKEFSTIYLTKIDGENSMFKTESIECLYCRIDELNAEWEDYTYQEPLIKDEKIRKAVRAWAEALHVTKVYIRPIKSTLCITLLHDEIYDDQFKIELPYSHHLGGFYYKITELCGESES